MRDGKPTPIIRRFIVEEPDKSAAYFAASAEAQRTAEVGPKWTSFDAREASTIALPLEI